MGHGFVSLDVYTYIPVYQLDSGSYDNTSLIKLCTFGMFTLKFYFISFSSEIGNTCTEESGSLIDILSGCLQDYVSHDNSELI